ncbi:PPE family protein [Mycobacterium colombiense]|uniref:PPE family protein n=1 Tax=Mycobacterium colombiense TaxID=339268 RepID=UPI00097D4D88|nr:PPE family protein [Mycobacterium colombiense]
MMLDYGAFPPEFNSARIYSGPGSGSLMAAASAWSALAAELNSAALSYEQVVTALSSEEWTGTASAAMAQAAAPYAAWMTATAAQAEEAAGQARAAAAAYETALASSVPPPLIAANRMQSQQLQATNVLGQNTPLIAQLEAQYGEMWAQDAGAMYSYAGQSAVATKQTPFQKAPEVANPSAQTTQTAAVTNATANSTATNTSKTLQSLATPATSSTVKAAATTASTTSTDPLSELWFLLTGQTSLPTSLGSAVNGYSPFASLFYNTEGLPYFSTGMANTFTQISKTVGLIGGAPAAAAKALPGLGGLGGMLGGGAAAAHPVAALGSAASVGGKLSVPVAWSGASGAAPALGHAIPVSSISAAPEAAGGPGNLLGGMPLAGAGAAGHGVAGPKYGFRPTVMARPPFAG